MNVYVRETARELGRMGAHVDVFTRSQNPGIPRVVAMGARARASSTSPAGPAGADAARGGARPPRRVRGRASSASGTSEGLDYDLIHAHYWLSGVAGLALRERWDAPLVQMFHTLGRLKNTVAQTRGRGRARAADRRGDADRRRGRPHRRRQRGGARAPRLVLRRARRARRRSSRAASTPSCSSRWIAPAAQGPARARARAAPDLRRAARSPSRDSRRCSTRWRRAAAEATLLIIGGDQDEPDNGHGAYLRERVRALGLERRVRFLGAQPQQPAPALLRRGRRDRDAVVLRVVRHGGARGDGLRQPRGRLARGRAHDDDPATASPGTSCRRAIRSRSPTAWRASSPTTRPRARLGREAVALGRRAPLALRRREGVRALLDAAARPAAPSPRPALPAAALVDEALGLTRRARRRLVGDRSRRDAACRWLAMRAARRRARRRAIPERSDMLQGVKAVSHHRITHHCTALPETIVKKKRQQRQFPSGSPRRAARDEAEARRRRKPAKPAPRAPATSPGSQPRPSAALAPTSPVERPVDEVIVLETPEPRFASRVLPPEADRPFRHVPARHLLRRREREPAGAHRARDRAPRGRSDGAPHRLRGRRQLAGDRPRHRAPARAARRAPHPQRAVGRRARLERSPDRRRRRRVARGRAAGRRARDHLDDRAFDAVGDVAASLGIEFRRLSHQAHQRVRRRRARRSRRRRAASRSRAIAAAADGAVRGAAAGLRRARAGERARASSRGGRRRAASADRAPAPRAAAPARGSAEHTAPHDELIARGARPACSARPARRHARHARERAQVARLQPPTGLAAPDHAAAANQGDRAEPHRCRHAGGQSSPATSTPRSRSTRNPWSWS